MPLGERGCVLPPSRPPCTSTRACFCKVPWPQHPPGPAASRLLLPQKLLRSSPQNPQKTPPPAARPPRSQLFLLRAELTGQPPQPRPALPTASQWGTLISLTFPQPLVTTPSLPVMATLSGSICEALSPPLSSTATPDPGRASWPHTPRLTQSLSSNSIPPLLCKMSP